MWHKGDPWRVVDSLDRLNEQIREACPRAVPPATDVRSWGSIANDEHSSSSDHYPHYYAALGSVAVVCARDFPHAPALGLDAHAIAEQLRISRDKRIAYVISNRRITGPNHRWRWDPYDEDDPHDTHIHVSTVHTAAADDTRNWRIAPPAPPPPPPPPPYRRPVAALFALKGVSTVPSYLIKHGEHPEVFALYPTGMVRHIGPAEYEAYTKDAAVPVPELVTDDEAEYERLLMYVRAIQD